MAESRAGRPRKVNWQPAFLAALSACGSPASAAAAAGVGRATAYRARAVDADFAAAWDDALEGAADALEDEAARRAVRGDDRPVLYKGQPVGCWFGPDGRALPPSGDPPAAREARGERYGVLHESVRSDALLMFLLRAVRPRKYRDHARVEAVAVVGTPEPPFDWKAKLDELTREFEAEDAARGAG